MTVFKVEATIEITVQEPLVITTTSPIPTAVRGEPYNFTLTAEGSEPPYTWAIVDSDLPEGLSLDPATGVISGTPTVSGTTSFDVEVQTGS